MTVKERGYIEQALASGEVLSSMLGKGSKKLRKGEDVKEFAKNLGKIGGKVAKFLKGLGGLVSLISVFLPSEAEILHKELLKRFDRIDAKLASIDNKLEKLPNTIKWLSEKQKYNTYVHTINIFDTKLLELSNSSAKEAKRQEIIGLSTCSYDVAGERLVVLMTETQIIDYYFNYTDWDRRSVLEFFQTTYDYILKASKIEISMLELKNVTTDYNPAISDQEIQELVKEKTDQWILKLQKVEDKMKQWDEWARKDYGVVEKTLDTELNKYISDSSMLSLSTSDFVGKVREKLDEKYFWRKWAVFSSKTPKNDDTQCFTKNKYVRHKKFKSDSRLLVVVNYDINSNQQTTCSAEGGKFKTARNAMTWTSGYWNDDCKNDDGVWIDCDNMMSNAQKIVEAKLPSGGFAMAVYHYDNDLKVPDLAVSVTKDPYSLGQALDIQTCDWCEKKKNTCDTDDPSYPNCGYSGYPNKFKILTFC